MKTIRNKELLLNYFVRHGIETIFDKDILDFAQLRSYEKNETIMEAESELEYYFLLVEGKIKISYPFENGKGMLLKFYRDFNVIGDLELMKNMPVRCNVEAVQNCRLIAVPVAVLREEYMDNVKFLHHLIASLSMKLDATMNNSSYNMAYPLSNRLASYLTEYITENDEIRLNSSYQEIAQFLGTTYRHLSRTLNELEEKAIIRCEGRTIHLLDEGKLRALSKNLYKGSV